MYGCNIFFSFYLLLSPFKQHCSGCPNTGEDGKGWPTMCWCMALGSGGADETFMEAMAGQGLEPTSALGVGGSPKAPIITLSLCTSNSVRKNDGRKWWSKGLLEVCAQNEVLGHIVICQLTTQHRPGQEAVIYATDCFVSGIKVIFFRHTIQPVMYLNQTLEIASWPACCVSIDCCCTYCDHWFFWMFFFFFRTRV